MMLSMHMMMALSLKTPELALEPKEAQALGVAIANVAKYYPHVADEKQLAWANLAMIMFGVYATRAGAIVLRKKREKQVKSTPNVRPVNFGG